MKNLKGLVFLALAAGLGYGVFLWTVCRFYVDVDKMAVITAKIGRDRPPGQILAKEGEKGVREEVLGEGRHFLNPWAYEVEIRDSMTIPAGKVGVVTSKVGRDLPTGRFLADEGEKGVRRGVLGPGKYRLNPHGYQIDVVDMISIPIGYVGVVTSLSETRPEAGAGENGEVSSIRRDILQPGLYHINPKEFKCDILEVGVNQVSLLGEKGGMVVTKTAQVTQNALMEELQGNMLREQAQKRNDYVSRSSSYQSNAAQVMESTRPGDEPFHDRNAPQAMAPLNINQMVSFPSRDGFAISLDMSLEFELLPEHVPFLYQSYGDLPAVVDKIILPQILSVSRLKGSAYRAKDFIVGEGREKFQADLTETLAKVLLEKRVVVHNALIRHVNVPKQILDPIQQASVAIEIDLTNKEKQTTAKKQAELNTETGMVAQKMNQVMQETEKLKAEVEADTRKQVATIAANTQRREAEIARETAEIRARKARTLGEASAKKVALVEGERARGFELKAAAFGDPEAYALWEFADKLNPAVNIQILHAGEGTLWTDLQRATLGDLGGAKTLQAPPPAKGK
jgi:hypothetical protein